MSGQGALVLAVVCATVLLMAGCAVGLVGLPPMVMYPCITPDPNNESVENQTFSFSYAGRIETLTVEIPLSVYSGAKRADKNATLIGRVPRREWLAGYYRSFMEDPAQDAFMGMLIDQLRAIRTARGLSDDEYVEMIVCFVQTIPYRTPTEPGPPKYPVEILAEGAGDCDDKSLLLVALLSREGYNCSLMYFEPETHMAVGIAGDEAAGYRGTGYLFIESTRISLVGAASEYLSGGVEVASEPLVIQMGNGRRLFHSWSDVAAILDALGTADRRKRILAAEKAEAGTAMARLAGSGRLREYSLRAAEYSRISAEYDETSAVADRIRHHLDDRTGLTRWLAGQRAAGSGTSLEGGSNGFVPIGSDHQMGDEVEYPPEEDELTVRDDVADHVREDRRIEGADISLGIDDAADHQAELR